jgi:cellulose synthase/poly-beta-1,6-N-acetylglucosamine synthase-like glycosyltransferase
MQRLNEGESMPQAAPVQPMSRLLAIVPAYNEAGAILDTLAELWTHAPQFDVVVVDDGSTDDTGAIAARAGARASIGKRRRKRTTKKVAAWGLGALGLGVLSVAVATVARASTPPRQSLLLA